MCLQLTIKKSFKKKKKFKLGTDTLPTKLHGIMTVTLTLGFGLR